MLWISVKKGLAGWVATPRFSNGWGDLRSLPTILVENHSLKPYKQRVLGTYVFIDSAIDALAANDKALNEAVRKELDFKPTQLVVERGYAKQPDTIEFKGIAYSRSESALSGQSEVKYLGRLKTMTRYLFFGKKKLKRLLMCQARFTFHLRTVTLLKS